MVSSGYPYLSSINQVIMKKVLLPFLFFCLLFQAIAQQPIAKEDLKKLKKMENALKTYSNNMINEEHWYMRFQADSFFIKGFVHALQVPNSFSYPFDSIKTVSKLYAPDSSFRIFTWQMMKDFTYYRQRGAIQMRTSDGSLKLFPLFDVSSFTQAPNDSVRNIKNWIGALYYKILTNKIGNKPVYTLLGFDENGPRSNKKWIDILTFDEVGIPHFGGPQYFRFGKDSSGKIPCIARFSVEYKKESRMRVLFDKEADMIVYDHLSSEINEPENQYTYVPDGSYEALQWKNNAWEHISKLVTQELGDGFAPMEKALLDEEGNFNQKKLEQQSKKNIQLQQKEAKEENNKRINDKRKGNLKPEENVDN